MTPHLHREFVAGCYRCDLNKDEVSVLLGVGTCPYCGEEDVDDRCPDPLCESNEPVRMSRSRFGTRNH